MMSLMLIWVLSTNVCTDDLEGKLVTRSQNSAVPSFCGVYKALVKLLPKPPWMGERKTGWVNAQLGRFHS